MFGAIRNAYDRFKGAGDYALTVPSLDGAFNPNMLIEDAPALVEYKGADNVVVSGGEVYFSSQGTVFGRSAQGELEAVSDSRASVTAMAGNAAGSLAIAREGEDISIRNPDGSWRQCPRLSVSGDITALTFLDDRTLALTIGAEGRAAKEWRTDLMERGRSGSVWVIEATGAPRKIADSLAYPNGVTAHAGGGLLVSVAWEAALRLLGPDGASRSVLTNLPGYPSRIVSSAKGGYWLSIFSPRNQLVELVLREDAFRSRMIKEMDPDYWICPQLAPAVSPLEVMQDGAQKIGGSIKPWAPSLSYGLVVRIGADLLAKQSFHSRANGQRHGITSVAEFGNEVLATSRGGGCIVALASGDAL